MPCITYSTPEEEEAEKRCKHMKNELDRVTDVACHLLRLYKGRTSHLPPKIRDWWKMHQAQDLAREKAATDERRRLRGVALGKLTAADLKMELDLKRALGLGVPI